MKLTTIIVMSGFIVAGSTSFAAARSSMLAQPSTDCLDKGNWSKHSYTSAPVRVASNEVRREQPVRTRNGPGAEGDGSTQRRN